MQYVCINYLTRPLRYSNGGFLFYRICRRIEASLAANGEARRVETNAQTKLLASGEAAAASCSSGACAAAPLHASAKLASVAVLRITRTLLGRTSA